jgi:hypothetical protein
MATQPGRTSTRPRREQNSQNTNANTPDTQPDVFTNTNPPPQTPAPLKTRLGDKADDPAELGNVLDALCTEISKSNNRSDAVTWRVNGEQLNLLKDIAKQLGNVGRKSVSRIIQELAYLKTQVENFRLDVETRLDTIDENLHPLHIPNNTPTSIPLSQQQHPPAIPSKNFMPNRPREQPRLEDVTLTQTNPANPAHADTPYPQLRNLVDDAIKAANIKDNEGFLKVRSVTRHPSKDLVINMHTITAADRLREDDSWLKHLVPDSSLRLQQKIYAVICHRMPATFNPSSKTDVDMLKKENPTILSNSTVKKVVWAKSSRVNPAGKAQKQHSSLIIHLTSKEAANTAIKKSIVYQGQRLVTEKSRRSIIQCHQCQRFGHTAARCTRNPQCARCAAEHNTNQCTCPSNPQCQDMNKCSHIKTKCALCGEEHKSTSKDCTQRKHAEAVLEKTNNEGGYLYFTESY